MLDAVTQAPHRHLPRHPRRQGVRPKSQAEQTLTHANKQLIERFEAKTKAATINRLWGNSA